MFKLINLRNSLRLANIRHYQPLRQQNRRRLLSNKDNKLEIMGPSDKAPNINSQEYELQNIDSQSI